MPVEGTNKKTALSIQNKQHIFPTTKWKVISVKFFRDKSLTYSTLVLGLLFLCIFFLGLIIYSIIFQPAHTTRPQVISIILFICIAFLIASIKYPLHFQKILAINKQNILNPTVLRRANLLHVFFIFSFLVGVGLATDGLTWEESPDKSFLLRSSFFGLILIFSLLWWNRIKPGYYVSLITISSFTVIAAFSDIPIHIVEGRTAYLLILPITLSAFVLPPYFSYAFATFSTLISASLSLTSGLDLNSPQYLAFFLFAHISFIASSELEKSLLSVHETNEYLENRVEERTRDLEDLNRYITTYMSQQAHDMRTPILGLRLYVDKLETSLPTQEVDTLKTELKYLLDMLTNMSDVAKLQLGKLEKTIDLFPLNLNHLLLHQIHALRPHAEVKGLQFEYLELDPDIHVTGNKGYLARVFTNLISNAIKYTDTGFVKIEAGLELNRARVLIADSGIGIPPDELSEVFSRFFRASNVGGREGTGLGLALVKDIVEIHGGDIHVESQVGSGTRFTVTLPTESTPVDDSSIPK